MSSTGPKWRREDQPSEAPSAVFRLGSQGFSSGCSPRFRRDARPRSPQIDDLNIRCDPQALSIRPLRRRTSQYRILSRSGPAGNQGTQSLQPGRAVGVGQRDPVPHFLHVRCRMMVISLHELPSELRRQPTGRPSSSPPPTPHQQDDHVPLHPQDYPVWRRFKCVLGGWRTWSEGNDSARSAPCLAAEDAGQRPRMRDFCSHWGSSGSESSAGRGEAPSSYRDYFGNLGFFCAIFRDITPIAARQPLGWNSVISGLVFWLGFLRLGCSAERRQRRSRVRSAYREKVSAAIADQDS